MSQSNDCIFCQIVAGTAPAHRVHEDELTLTFLDIFPVARGHTLIVTRDHYENVLEAEPAAIAAIGQRSVAIARAIRSALKPDGIGVFQLNGAAAGQTVFHYHMHLIPRHAGDSLQIHSRVRGDDMALAETAALLRRHLDPP
jgi:histidine triad (HIT) family protein